MSDDALPKEIEDEIVELEFRLDASLPALRSAILAALSAERQRAEEAEANAAAAERLAEERRERAKRAESRLSAVEGALGLARDVLEEVEDEQVCCRICGGEGTFVETDADVYAGSIHHEPGCRLMAALAAARRVLDGTAVAGKEEGR